MATIFTALFTGGENVSFVVEFMDNEGDIDIELQSSGSISQ